MKLAKLPSRTNVLLTNEERRIIELEAAMKDILNSKHLETIKQIAAEQIGEDPDDFIDDEDFVDADFDFEELDFENDR